MKQSLRNKLVMKTQLMLERDTNSIVSTAEKNFLIQRVRTETFKKLEVEDNELEDIAFKAFSSFNMRGFSFQIEAKSLWEEAFLESLAFKIELALRPLERADDWLAFLATYGRFGPGGSLDASQPYPVKRFGEALTYSDKALIVPYKKQCENEGLRAPEIQRQRNFGFIKHEASRAQFVPKSTKTYRMVTTQCSLDMYFQLGLHEFLIQRLEELYGFSLDTQADINKAWARLGSIDGHFCTVDSTMASDSIYLDPLVNANILPRWFGELLKTLQPRLLTYKDKVIKVSMCGTQGCGYTFALMTLILYCVVDSAYELIGITPTPQNRGVFGDDIVCVKRSYDLLIRAMELVGFIPNKEKSFSEGGFRESCGGDYLNGYPVRPVFIRRLTTVQHVCVAYNGLLIQCLLHDFYLWDTLKYLYNVARSMGAPRVPFDSQEDAGLFTPHSYDNFIFVPEKRFMPVYIDLRRDLTTSIGIIHPDGLVRCAIQSRIVQDTEGLLFTEIRELNPSYRVRKLDADEGETPFEGFHIPLGWPRKRGWLECHLASMRIDIWVNA